MDNINIEKAKKAIMPNIAHQLNGLVWLGENIKDSIQLNENRRFRSNLCKGV